MGKKYKLFKTSIHFFSKFGTEFVDAFAGGSCSTTAIHTRQALYYQYVDQARHNKRSAEHLFRDFNRLRQ